MNKKIITKVSSAIKSELNKFNVLFMALFFSILFPLVTHALEAKNIIEKITVLLKDYVVGLIFTLGFVYFFWGVVQYVLYPDDGEKKDKGKSMMITGIIALTVMFTVYGLIRMTINTLGLSETEKIAVPKIPSGQ